MIHFGGEKVNIHFCTNNNIKTRIWNRIPYIYNLFYYNPKNLIYLASNSNLPIASVVMIGLLLSEFISNTIFIMHQFQ